MFENSVKAMGMARAMAAHAAARQQLIARNVANADTPGFRPQDMPAFADALRDAAGPGLRATRPGHFGPGDGTAMEPVTLPGRPSPNGNAVSVEQEMVRAAEVRMQHDMALAIREALSGAIKTALGRR